MIRFLLFPLQVSHGSEFAVISVLAFLVIAAIWILHTRLQQRRRENKEMEKTILNLQTRLSELEGNASSQKDAGELPLTEDRRLFLLLDELVERNRLFTISEINRDKLAELIGVDRNEFARIIREQSGCKNMSDYLNRKRVSYVVEMMQSHPHFTLEAIAKDCGIKSTSTFNRVFKEYIGASPSEYRNRLIINAVEGG